MTSDLKNALNRDIYHVHDLAGFPIPAVDDRAQRLAGDPKATEQDIIAENIKFLIVYAKRLLKQTQDVLKRFPLVKRQTYFFDADTNLRLCKQIELAQTNSETLAAARAIIDNVATLRNKVKSSIPDFVSETRTIVLTFFLPSAGAITLAFVGALFAKYITFSVAMSCTIFGVILLYAFLVTILKLPKDWYNSSD